MWRWLGLYLAFVCEAAVLLLGVSHCWPAAGRRVRMVRVAQGLHTNVAGSGSARYILFSSCEAVVRLGGVVEAGEGLTAGCERCCNHALTAISALFWYKFLTASGLLFSQSVVYRQATLHAAAGKHSCPGETAPLTWACGGISTQPARDGARST